MLEKRAPATLPQPEAPASKLKLVEPIKRCSVFTLKHLASA
jgi:hypothetical protein